MTLQDGRPPVASTDASPNAKAPGEDLAALAGELKKAREEIDGLRAALDEKTRELERARAALHALQSGVVHASTGASEQKGGPATSRSEAAASGATRADAEPARSRSSAAWEAAIATRRQARASLGLRDPVRQAEETVTRSNSSLPEPTPAPPIVALAPRPAPPSPATDARRSAPVVPPPSPAPPGQPPTVPLGSASPPAQTAPSSVPITDGSARPTPPVGTTVLDVLGSDPSLAAAQREAIRTVYARFAPNVRATPAAETGRWTVGDALQTDPHLQRGQKEAIATMYRTFTRGR